MVNNPKPGHQPRGAQTRIDPSVVSRRILRQLLRLYDLPRVRAIAHRVVGSPVRSFVGNLLRSLTDPSAADLAKFVRGMDFVIFANAYPSADRHYGGEFIRTRVEQYLAHGLRGGVIEINSRNAVRRVEEEGTLPVLRLSARPSKQAIRGLVRRGRLAVIAHSPSPDTQELLGNHVPGEQLAFWFHGYDVIDYRRMYYNFRKDELEARRHKLDQQNLRRKEVNKESFDDVIITKVVVSRYLMETARRDAGVSDNNVRIIHNYIDGDFYNYVDRDVGRPVRVLLLRPFIRMKYAADIATAALRLLSDRPGFERLSITVRGFGENFEADTADLRGLPNVVIEEGYCTREEMRAYYQSHDIALCPTRHDTQGVSLGEAMASGMACITHDVSAIPEFADDTCAVLVRPDDVRAYAEAIWNLAHDPRRIARLGRAAAERVRCQCGPEATIHREVALIRELQGQAA